MGIVCNNLRLMKRDMRKLKQFSFHNSKPHLEHLRMIKLIKHYISNLKELD